MRSRVRPVDSAGVATGPNALRGSVPNRSHALGSALTLAGSPDHHRAINIRAVNLEHRLRIIEANCADLAHGRLAS